MHPGVQRKAFPAFSNALDALPADGAARADFRQGFVGFILKGLPLTGFN